MGGLEALESEAALGVDSSVAGAADASSVAGAADVSSVATGAVDVVAASSARGVLDFFLCLCLCSTSAGVSSVLAAEEEAAAAMSVSFEEEAVAAPVVAGVLRSAMMSCSHSFGLVVGAYLLIGIPSLLQRNLVKFHLM